ncbi:MAG: ZIP family metal transporter [bacterium]
MILPLIYGLIACLASLGGSLLAVRGAANERLLNRLTALSGGMLLSSAFLRILPEALHLNRTSATISLLFFFLFFYALEDFMMIHSCPEYTHHCPSHIMGNLAFFGLSLHSLVDGIAVGSTFRFSPSLGLVASLAVIFHKSGDGLALSSLLLSAGTGKRKVILASLAIAFATLLGAVLSYSLTGARPSPVLLASLLGISAGSFIYISTSDLLPELHRERDFSLFAFLLLGMLFIIGLTFLFPAD